MKRSVHNLRPAPQEDRNRGPVLWVVSELYYPELTSTGYYLTAIAERLAARRTVKALCGQPAYSARGTRVARRETRNGVVIHRASSTVWNKDRLFGKLVNLATLSLAIFVEALFRIKRGDTALVVTNPPLLPFLIAAVCRLKGARCVLLIHDVYPNVLVAAGMVRENHPVVRLINACVRGLYRRVDRVVTIGRDMAMLAAEKLAGSIDHLSIIPNWGEVSRIRPRDKTGNALLKKLGLEGKFIVQYAGNMGRSHDLETVLRSARELERDGGIHFLFVGEGAKKDWLRRESARLSNVTVIDPLPRAERDTVLAACDLSLIPFVPGMSGVSVPSRMYNVMASGRPLLAMCDRGSEIGMVIREERIGWVVDCGDTAGLAEAIRFSSGAPVLLAEMGVRARLAAERKYSEDRVLDRWEAAMRELDGEVAAPAQKVA